MWLWLRPVATAPIRPLAGEPPYAMGVALEKAKRPKKKKSQHCKSKAKAVREEVLDLTRP